MKLLNKKIFNFILILFSVSSCTKSIYRVTNFDDMRAELNVTPDRIILECEWQREHEIKNAYGFLMHVLDDENTVLTVAQTNIIDKDSCFLRMNKIRQILKNGKSIYIGGMGNINRTKIKEEKQYTFPTHGTFYSNGRSLQYIVIANEFGECYQAYQLDRRPCPSDQFPIGKNF